MDINNTSISCLEMRRAPIRRRKNEKQVDIAKKMQEPPELYANVGNNQPNFAYAEVIAFAETNEVALLKKRTIRYQSPLVWDPLTCAL